MDIRKKQIYRAILEDLYSSTNGLFAYTLYGRYKLQPYEAVEFMDTFEKSGYISVDDNLRIKLTSQGREKISIITNELLNSHNEEYISVFSRPIEKIGIYSPYLPGKSFILRYKEQRNKKETSK